MGLFGPKKKSDTSTPPPGQSRPSITSVVSSPSVSSATKNTSTTPKAIVRRPYLHSQATQERMPPPPIHENEIAILKAQVVDLRQCYDNKELFDCLISDVDRNRLTQITMLLAESGDYIKMQSVMDQTEILDKLLADRLSEKHENVRRSIQTASSSDSLDKSIDEVIIEISALDFSLLSLTALQTKLSYFEYFLFNFQDAEFDKVLTLSGKIEEMRRVYLKKTGDLSSSSNEQNQPELVQEAGVPMDDQDNSMYAALPEPPVMEPTIAKELVNLEQAGILLDKVHHVLLKNAFGLWIDRHVQMGHKNEYVFTLLACVGALALRNGLSCWREADVEQISLRLETEQKEQLLNQNVLTIIACVDTIALRNGFLYWREADVEQKTLRLETQQKEQLLSQKISTMVSCFDTIALRNGLSCWREAHLERCTLQQEAEQKEQHLDDLRRRALARLMIEWRLLTLAQTYHFRGLKQKAFRSLVCTNVSELAFRTACLRRRFNKWAFMASLRKAWIVKKNLNLQKRILTVWSGEVVLRKGHLLKQGLLAANTDRRVLQLTWMSWATAVLFEKKMLNDCETKANTLLLKGSIVAWSQLTHTQFAYIQSVEAKVNFAHVGRSMRAWSELLHTQTVCMQNVETKVSFALIKRSMRAWHELLIAEQSIQVKCKTKYCISLSKRVMLVWLGTALAEQQRQGTIQPNRRLTGSVFKQWIALVHAREAALSMAKTHRFRKVLLGWKMHIQDIHRRDEAIAHASLCQLGPVISAWQTHTTQLSNNLFSFSVSHNERLVVSFMNEWKRLVKKRRSQNDKIKANAFSAWMSIKVGVHQLGLVRTMFVAWNEYVKKVCSSPVKMSASPILQGWVEVADARKSKVQALQGAIRRKRMKDALDYLTDQTHSRAVSPVHGASTPPQSDSPTITEPRRIEHYYIDDDALVPPIKPRTADEVRRSTEKLIVKTQMFLSRTRLNASSPTPPRVGKIINAPLPFHPPKIVSPPRDKCYLSRSPDEQYFEQFVSKWKLEEKKWVL